MRQCLATSRHRIWSSYQRNRGIYPPGGFYHISYHGVAMRTQLTFLTLVMFLANALAAIAQQPRTLHVYHIGNSLTRSITMDRLHLLFAEGGIDYQFSTQLAAGCTLSRHWAAREKGLSTRQWETNQRSGESWEPGGPDWDPNPKRFGPYWEALANHKWDAIVLQPYRSHMKEDLPALRHFLKFALANQSAKRFYLYQTWPNRPIINAQEKDREKRSYANIDFPALWERTYPYDEQSEKPTGDAYQSHDYFQQLITKLNDEFREKLTKPVGMIPVGDVWDACDKRIKAGEILGLEQLYARNPKLIPGWDPKTGTDAGVNIFYADGIHPNPIPHLEGNVANYVNGLTIYSVLSGQTPVGMSGANYGLDDQLDASLMKALQQTIWQVVISSPHTGVQ